jgi:hypothetical protein
MSWFGWSFWDDYVVPNMTDSTRSVLQPKYLEYRHKVQHAQRVLEGGLIGNKLNHGISIASALFFEYYIEGHKFSVTRASIYYMAMYAFINSFLLNYALDEAMKGLLLTIEGVDDFFTESGTHSDAAKEAAKEAAKGDETEDMTEDVVDIEDYHADYDEYIGDDDD